MDRHVPPIGLRTVKTGLAVALALLFADLRGSPLPIFAAIGDQRDEPHGGRRV